MGRDTTASARMAAKRDRERIAGLRRLNVAMKPEVFEKLAALMKQYNCTSQARLIELLVEDGAKSPESRKERGVRNAVTDKWSKAKKNALIKQPQETQKTIPPAEAPKSKLNAVTSPKELSPAQMSLFEK
jgi:hypothetical protein